MLRFWIAAQLHLQKALRFLQREPETTAKDLQFIRSMVTGKLARHPALHGMVIAIANKLDNLERNKSSMRNPKRYLEKRSQLVIH